MSSSSAAARSSASSRLFPIPAGTLDQREPALAAHGLGQRGAQRLELAVALEEQLCRAGVGIGRTS